uniref:Uncharacterized protein n=2 Tax=Caenorhabditis japonica TaxID=281687 RepID=A0A8R1EMX9_CAEJA
MMIQEIRLYRAKDKNPSRASLSRVAGMKGEQVRENINAVVRSMKVFMGALIERAEWNKFGRVERGAG